MATKPDEILSEKEHQHSEKCNHADHEHHHEAHSAHAHHEHGSACSHDHEHDESCNHDHEAEHEHQHSAACNHDHHDHAHHDHGHQHSAACNHDHDHDHHHHDHDHDHEHHHHDGECNHDHDHDHHHHHIESRIGTRLAETGGHACQLDLSILIPGETDEFGRFEQLEELLEARTGISDVHVRRDGGAAEICVHYDHDQISLDQLVALVKSTGAQVSKRYRHQSWFTHGIESAQNGYAIEEAVRKIPGVLTANAAYAAERFIAEYDSQLTNPKAIAEAVKKLGYELEEPAHGHVCAHHPGKGGFGANWHMPLVYTSGVLIAAGWILRTFAPVPEIVPTILFALAVVSGGFFAVKGAITSLRQGLFDIETLMVLAAVGACFLGAWFEGAFLLFLFSLGHALEHRAMEKARKELEALGKLRPEKARVKRGDEIIETPVERVWRGDIIVIRPGDRVALDGIIRSGESSLDQSSITGESVPIAKTVGDQVFAGTINAEAALEIEVTKLSSESVISRVVEMVTEAEAQKSPTQRFAKNLERIFVPIVLVIAPLLTLFLYFGQGLNLRDSVLRGISLLVAASPCALAIATPAAVLSAVARAAKGGVLIKGGAHLETLGRVAVLAFDKTGTLTRGKPRIVTVFPLEGVGETEFLEVTAAAESNSSHPLATAIVNGAKERGIEIKASESTEAVHGKGLHSVVEGKNVSVGNLSLFAGETVPEAVAAKAKELEAAGQTTMIVRQDNRFLGVIGVADTLRPEAKKALSELRRIGIHRKVMLSGDNQLVADAIAKQVGIDEAFGSLMPEGKVEQLKKLAKEGGVGMVGDGVNDAPALAAASVGIAMGGTGSDVALETADLVLMSESLERLPFAVELSRKATGIIRQNLVIALGVSAILMIATIFGWVAISETIILHEGSTLLVVFNGLRLLLFRD